MDQKSIDKLNQLHPSIRQDALDAYDEACRLTPVGIHPVIDQTIRTFEESTKLYNQGRTTPGSIVSNAKAGQSYHNYGLALDFHLQVNGKDKWLVDKNWMIVVKCFKDRGFKWGGDFKSIPDAPHFEKSPLHWKELLALHNSGKFIPGETYVNV